MEKSWGRRTAHGFLAFAFWAVLAGAGVGNLIEAAQTGAIHGSMGSKVLLSEAPALFWFDVTLVSLLTAVIIVLLGIGICALLGRKKTDGKIDAYLAARGKLRYEREFRSNRVP